MNLARECPECGGAWDGGKTCEGCFHQMLAWEWEYPGNLAVHHLMVLGYHLQHPSLYSPEGLAEARGLLVEFLERGTSPEEVRQRTRARVDSGHRRWKIKGTPASHGAYDPPIRWTMTAADVIERGMDRYCDSVRAWARSILEDVRSQMSDDPRHPAAGSAGPTSDI